MSDALRIAVSCNDFPPDFAGGTERVVQALVRELRDGRDSCLVICGSERPHAAGEIQSDAQADPQVLRLPLAADEGYHLRVARPRLATRFREILVRERIQVLHLHHWSHLFDTQVQVARELGLGVVVTLHDMWSHCPRFFRRPVDPRLRCPEGAERDACVACVAGEVGAEPGMVQAQLAARDHNLCRELELAHFRTAPSEDCARACREHLPWRVAPAIEVLPHGLLDELARLERSPRSPRLRVGTFGNLNREKGVDLLLEAMAGVAATLHLHGGVQPDFAAELRTRAAELAVELELHGPFDPGAGPPDHPAAQLDLAVFPSRCRETYGLVVDEALRLGTPTLVADIGALPERVARGGGQVVAGTDPGDWRRAIQCLVEDPSAYQVLQQSIPEDFPFIRDTARAYRALYQQAWAAAQH